MQCPVHSASGALSCAATVFSLRTSLAVALLLTDPAASICQKEGLLPPQHCRQGWQFSSNHLTSLQRPQTLRFVSAPLLKMLTYLFSVQSLLVCQESSSDTAAPGQPSLTQELLGPCQPTGHGADPSLIQHMVISISSRGT